ncbi:hypothetical protein FGO68_gene6731 [Halteria grandinella]|uniref:Uncharacterized protein n=1 Tax=Halteria grandinella TaxID=5974 RepID=A0A8J8NNL9_HALGN|nr:hypothetical protein FGO68_gene6731 [Halteria grandinella]
MQTQDQNFVGQCRDEFIEVNSDLIFWHQLPQLQSPRLNQSFQKLGKNFNIYQRQNTIAHQDQFLRNSERSIIRYQQEDFARRLTGLISTAQMNPVFGSQRSQTHRIQNSAYQNSQQTSAGQGLLLGNASSYMQTIQQQHNPQHYPFQHSMQVATPANLHQYNPAQQEPALTILPQRVPNPQGSQQLPIHSPYSIANQTMMSAHPYGSAEIVHHKFGSALSEDGPR